MCLAIHDRNFFRTVTALRSAERRPVAAQMLQTPEKKGDVLDVSKVAAEFDCECKKLLDAKLRFRGKRLVVNSLQL